MAKPKEGDTRGWNKKTGTGYKWKGGKWVQYKNNKPHGPFKGHGGITGNVDVVGGLKSQGGRLLRTIAGLPDDEQIKSARKSGEKYRANNKNNKTQSKTSEKEKNRNNPLRIVRDTIRNVNYEKNRRNKLESGDSSNNKTTTSNKNRNKLNFSQGAKAAESTKKSSTTKSTTKSEPKKSTVFTRHYKTGKTLGVMTGNQRRAYDKEAAGRTFEGQMEKAGLKKDDPRRETKFTSKSWQKRTKGGALKDSKENRGSGRKGGFGRGTYGKGLPSNPQLKTQTVKDDRDPNRHSIKIDKDKKKKNVPLGTRLSKMFD